MPFIDLLPSQYDFIFSPKLNPALVAGLGAGKSRAGIGRLIKLMIDDPGVNTLYAMPTYDLINLRAVPGIEEELDLWGLDYKRNKSGYSFDIAGLGIIYLRSYDNPDRFIAFEVGHSIVDEIDTLAKEKAELVWRKVTERTRQPTKNKLNSMGAVTSPDQGTNGFVYDRWVRNPTLEHHLIKGKTTDNIYLPEGYVDQIRANYDDKLVELYINGEFVNLTTDLVYHYFDPIKHHKDAIDGAHYHIGLDFNVGGCCSSVCLINGSQVHMIDEFVTHDTQSFITKLGTFKGKQLTIYPDASGQARATNASASDVDMIKQAGYNVSVGATNPFIRDRVNCVNMLMSKDRFFIDTNKCKETTNALSSQGYDKRGEPEKFDKHPAIDDYCDNLGYLLHRKFPILKPIVSTNIGGAR